MGLKENGRISERNDYVMGEYEMNTISVNDVIEAYKKFDSSSLAEDTVLDFISELTGLSIDKLIELIG